MTRKRVVLGERELEVMKALWKLERGTVYEVQKTIRGRRAYSTIQTMLNALERKGLVGHDVEERTFIYYPEVSRARSLQDHLRDLVDRVFDGSVEAVLTSLGKVEGLSDEQLAELRRLIKEGE